MMTYDRVFFHFIIYSMYTRSLIKLILFINLKTIFKVFSMIFNLELIYSFMIFDAFFKIVTYIYENAFVKFILFN